MHKRGAQLAYRLGFVLLCFLPTVLICGWIFARSLPGFVLSEKQEWERELSRRLGIRVTVKALAYPRPDTAELSDVALLDAETGEPIATLAMLEVVRGENRWKLIGWQAVVESRQLPLLKNRCEAQLLRLPSADLAPCEFWFRELTLRDAAQSLTLVDVAGGWQLSPHGPVAQLQFRLPEADAQASRATLVVERNRSTTPPATRWQIDSGSVALPSSLAAGLIPHVEQFGSRAQFAGRLEVVQSGEHFQGRLRGTLHDVDLDALVSEQFPHQLSGLATCHLEEALFDEHRLSVVRGTVKASHGFVSPSLLAAASEQMQLTSPLLSQLPAGSAPISYRQLSLGFDLRDTGLQLTGSADATRPGVLLSCAAGSLLEAPAQHRASPLSLARTLLPDREGHVPAAPSVQAFASFLPTPDLQPAATAARGGQHVPTRLGPSRDVPTPAIRQPDFGNSGGRGPD
jgi:hypothetical protein